MTNRSLTKTQLSITKRMGIAAVRLCLVMLLLLGISTVSYGDSGRVDSYRKGDATYRYFNMVGIVVYDHAGVVGYVGGSDASSYVYEMEGYWFTGGRDKCVYNTMEFHKSVSSPWYGVYTVKGDISESDRTNIKNTASDIYNDPDITYTLWGALGHESNPGTYVSVSEITGLRCDGLAEYCYEWNIIWVWGRTDNGQSDGTPQHFDISRTEWVGEHGFAPYPAPLKYSPWLHLTPWVQRGAEYFDSPYTRMRGSFPPPTGVSASDGTYTDRVRVTWNSVSGISWYRVYRAASAGATKVPQGSWQTGTTYNDTSASVGQTYYYWVKAKNDWGESGYSSYNTGWVEDEPPPFAIVPEAPVVWPEAWLNFDPVPDPGNVTWTVSGQGSIEQDTGLYQAPATDGQDTVIALTPTVSPDPTTTVAVSSATPDPLPPMYPPGCPTSMDVDGNWGIGIADVIFSLKYAVGSILPTPEELAAADFDCDGSVGIDDVINCLRTAVGKEPVLPVMSCPPATP